MIHESESFLESIVSIVVRIVRQQKGAEEEENVWVNSLMI